MAGVSSKATDSEVRANSVVKAAEYCAKANETISLARLVLALMYDYIAMNVGGQQVAENSSIVTFEHCRNQTSSVATGGASGRAGFLKVARAGLEPGASDSRHQDADVG